MLNYFQKGLRPSILAKLQNKDLKVENFVQIIKKAVVGKPIALSHYLQHGLVLLTRLSISSHYCDQGQHLESIDKICPGKTLSLEVPNYYQLQHLLPALTI